MRAEDRVGSMPGGVELVAVEAAAMIEELEKCLAGPRDDYETLLTKNNRGIDVGRRMGRGLIRLVQGLGESRVLGALSHVLPPFQGEPQAMVMVDGQPRVMRLSWEVAEFLDRVGPRQGLVVQIDPQVRAIVGFLEEPVQQTLRPYRVSAVRNGGAPPVIEAEALAGTERVLLSPAYTLPWEDVDTGATVYAHNGFAYQVRNGEEEKNATANWSFDSNSGVLHSHVVGAAQRSVMGRLLSMATQRAHPPSGYEPDGPALVMLNGPPGNGKTMMVKALYNALEDSLGREHLAARAVSATELLSKFVGETERNTRNFVRVLDREARNGKRLALGLLTELDTVAGSRALDPGNDGGVQRHVVGTLLTEFDGPRALHPNVMIVCDTNLLRSIDSAVKSRFQTELYVPKLSLEGLVALLAALHLRKPSVFGGAAPEELGKTVREALLAVIGHVQCGTTKVPVRAEHALSGRKATAAFIRCGDRYGTRLAAGLDLPLTPADLAQELKNVASEVGRAMTVPETREFAVEAGLVPEGKARDIVETPQIDFRPEGTSAHEDDDGVMERMLVRLRECTGASSEALSLRGSGGN